MKQQEDSFADKYKTELLFVAGLILIGAVFFYGYRANAGLRDALSSTTEQLNTQLTKICPADPRCAGGDETPREHGAARAGRGPEKNNGASEND